MRTNRNLYTLVAVAAGMAALAAGTITFAAGGATIQQRLTDPAGMIITGTNPVPVQQITGDCGATCAISAEAGSVLGLNVWGFTTTPGSLTLPGPTIVVDEGATVALTIANNLPAGAGDLLLELPSVAVADRIASPLIAVGTSGVVEFTANQVGTSIYRASASTPRGNLQSAMGLAGVLIVRPALTCPPVPLGGCAYSSDTTDFDDEALLATNDLDLSLANAADPLAFDMTDFHPTYHLINGKVFPDTEVIDTQPGHRVLIRYANLGLADHSMGLSGTRQTIVGRDSNPLAHASSDVVVPLNVGQTVDAIVTVPTEAKATYRYALSDQVVQTGAKSAAPAMTFLAVWQPEGAVPDVAGPRAHINAINPVESAGDVDLTFDGTITLPSGVDPATGGVFSIDVPGAPLLGLSSNVLTSVDGFAATFAGVVPATELSFLENGTHVLWVQLSNGITSGDPDGFAFTVDRAGPVVQPVQLDPAYTNGAVDVSVTATADASLTGTDLVQEGNASFGTACPDFTAQPIIGAGNYPLVVNGPLAIAELSGTIPAADVGALADGTYTVQVAAADSRNVWSNDGDGVSPASVCASADLIVDKLVPTTTSGSTDPAGPNDGTNAYNGVENFLEVVRILGTVNDAVSGVDKVEGFLETDVGGGFVETGEGTGFLFSPVDGSWGPVGSEDVYADIPLASVRSLTPGIHHIYIRAHDRAGNWGAATEATFLEIISSLPAITTLTHEPGANTAITATAYGSGVTVTNIEYSIGAIPLAGGSGVDVPLPAGPAQVVSVVIASPAVPAGSNVWVRAKDSLGYWGPATGLPTISNLLVVNSRRITGTASSNGTGGIAAVQYHVGPTATTPWTNVPLGNQAGAVIVNFAAQRPNSQPVFTGSTVWFRTQDAAGNWGPATAIAA